MLTSFDNNAKDHLKLKIKLEDKTIDILRNV